MTSNWAFIFLNFYILILRLLILQNFKQKENGPSNVVVQAAKSNMEGEDRAREPIVHLNCQLRIDAWMVK